MDDNVEDKNDLRYLTVKDAIDASLIGSDDLEVSHIQSTLSSILRNIKNEKKREEFIAKYKAFFPDGDPDLDSQDEA